MGSIIYMDFVITPTEYGGFFYAPKWHDGSEPAMTASTVEDAKVEIEAYWYEFYANRKNETGVY